MFENNLDFALNLDDKDELKEFRKEFSFPKHNNENVLYFAGHSLGLMPQNAKKYTEAEFDHWSKYGVEGHFMGDYPWVSYHENITQSFAKLVGALPGEVIAMNTLTVNLHLMLVSFYRPTKKKFKILIENNTFPSDKYAVDSQAKFHGFDPKDAVIELSPREGEMTIREEDLIDCIRKNGDELALIMLGNVNYLSGQKFNFESIVEEGHKVGAMVGFNLAHGAGNLLLDLHNWNVDFAVWCTYKYLNSGPGSIAGAFVHEKHGAEVEIPRFEGWWGHDKTSRFKMGPNFIPIGGAESWQLSNPPIFQLSALRGSLELFDKATMPKLRAKGDQLTSFLQFLLEENCSDSCRVVTPEESRGNMLCVKFKKDPRKLVNSFKDKGVICDFREPDILRMAPAPMYNNFSDVFKLVKVIQEATK